LNDSVIDRIAPTYRPAARPRGFQSWRTLLFLHWPVSVSELRSIVPAGLEIDTHEGVAYVGLVPFAMEGVRPLWLPEALSMAFLETNVRTYVHVGGRDPGVYFFSLDAASRVAVRVARAFWSLPYELSEMTLERHGDAVRYRVTRRSGTRPRLELAYRIDAPLGPSAPGTLEHFLLERYLLHVERRGRLWTGQVHHQPYPVQCAELHELGDELIAATGLSVNGPAPLVHYAEGVDVEIFGLKPRS
jgi:uncharacterized protein YqjF (DUF2071 family)